MEVLFPRCAGLDVHKYTVVACVRCVIAPKAQEVQTFGTTTRELLELSDWLGSHGCTHVAMESTGVYWKPASNDNPYSEAQFKTLKYHPSFPARFGSIEDARSFCRRFFTWYNTAHRHSGLAMFTPEDVHYGRSTEKLLQRREVLEAAYQAHPERFVNGRPIPSPAPAKAWINAPPAPGAESDVGSQ